MTRLVYPGFLDPFSPMHSDLYLAYEYKTTPLLDVLAKPRPVHYLLFHFAALTGFKTMMLLGALLGVLYAYSVQALFAQLSGRPGLLALFTYYAVTFSHDGFAFTYSYDSTARLAGIFAVLAMASFWHFLEARGRRWSLWAAFGFSALSIFSKETFALPMLLFVGWTATWKTRSALSALRFTAPWGLLSAACLAIAAIGSSMYVNPGAGPGDPYRMTHDFRVVLGNLWSDIASIPVAPVLLLLVLVVILPKPARGRWASLVALFWAMGFLSYLPHAVLSNHRLGYHLWQAVPFLFVFVLSFRVDGGRVRRICFTAAALALVCASLFAHRARAIKGNWWTAEQQGINRHLLSDLEAHSRQLSGRRRTALIGFEAIPFHPWHHPLYVNELLDYRGDWFFLARQGWRAGNVVYVEDLATPDHGFDCALFVSRDGHIVRVVEGEELSKVLGLLRSNPKAQAAVNLDGSLVNSLGASAAK